MGVFVATALVVALVGLAWYLGSRLPVQHRATRSTDLPVPPEQLWRLISEPADRRGVAYETVEAQPPRRLVRRVVGESSFGGTWTYVIEPVRDGSRITITEDGEVYNPLFRFVANYVIGHTRTIDSTLARLRSEIGSR